MDKITNKLKLGILITLFALFLLPTALAAVQVQNEDLIIPVNYEDLEDDDDELSVSRSITLTNNGIEIENVTLSLDALLTDYRLNLDHSTLQLAPGGSVDIILSGKIPVDEDMGQHGFGNLKVVDSVGEIKYALKTDVESMLEIKRLTIKVNGNTEETTDETGETVDDINPGDEIELRFQLKNIFDSSYDEGDLEGTINVQMDQSGFGEDIDEEIDFKIGAGQVFDSSDEEISFKFTVPLDVEDDEYTLDINYEAEDGNRANYQFDWEFSFTVERKEDDLRIERLNVMPTELSCTRTAKIVSDITNFGSNRQKHLYYTLQNDKLGLMQEFNFALEEGSSNDNSETLSFDFPISEDQAAGIYTVVTNLYYDYNQLVDRKTVDLIVKDCKTSTTGTTASKNENNQSTSTTNNPDKGSETSGENKITGGIIAKTLEQPYTTSDVLVAVMVIAILVILALIVLFVVILIKK